MSRKNRHSVVGTLTLPSHPLEAQQEIERYLRALQSYPESFARDPGLSFEKHLFSILQSDPAPDLSQPGV